MEEKRRKVKRGKAEKGKAEGGKAESGKREGGKAEKREGGRLRAESGGEEWRAERGGPGEARALETIKPGAVPGLCGSRERDQVDGATWGFSRLAWPARNAAHSIDRAKTPVKSRSLASVLRKK